MCKPWWSGSRGHWNEAGIVTANVCTTQSYQAVLTGFHSGMSLKTEKGCLPSSPSPGTCTKGVLWSAQNPLYWFCECLSILLTPKSPVFHFRRHCISSLDKGLFYSRQCWITKVEVDWSWVCKAQCLWMRDSCMTWEFAKRYTFCACQEGTYPPL